MGLTRTSSGLLLQDDFSDLSAWALGSGIAQEAAPSFVSFHRSPIALLDPGDDTDAGGVREGHWFIDDDGTWYIFYGAGDGSGGAGGPWRIQTASSTDKGLTWTRHGPVNFGLQIDDDAGDGYYAARDMLWMEKQGSTYYLHAMIAANVSANVPSEPYQTDLWTATSPLGPWAFVNMYLTNGTATELDYTEATSSSLVEFEGTTYEFYTAAGTDHGTVGHLASVATSATASHTGGLTKNTHFFPPNYIQLAGYDNGAENPKVFFSSKLGRWCMLLNVIGATGITDKNRLLLSTSLTDWSDATAFIIQTVAPFAGSNSVGIMSPLYVSGGAIAPEADGTVPVSFDADGTGHIDRSLFYTELVPSPHALLALRGTAVFGPDSFTHADGTVAGYNGWTVPVGSVNIASNKLDMGFSAGETIALQAGVSVQNPVLSAGFTIGAGCSVGFIFRYQDANNYYLVDCNRAGNNGTAITIYKKASGTFTVIGSGGSSVDISGTDVPFEVSMTGSTISVYALGILVGTVADTTFTAAGAVGLRNGSGGGGNRLVDNFGVWDNDLAAVRRASQSLEHDDFVAEFGIEYPASSSGKVGIEYRRTDDSNHYRALISAFGIWQLYKVVSGTATSIGSFSGDVLAESGTLPCRVVVSGDTHKFYLSGELQGEVTDNTYSSGSSIALVATNAADVRFRALAVYTSDTITVNGLTAGQVVTLRGAGDQPLATATASGASETFTIPHYGARSVTVGSRLHTLSGRAALWGGDEINVTASGGGAMALGLGLGIGL